MAEIQMEGITRKNCGAIRSELSIDVFGNIKLCNMDSGDDFRLNMGTVLEISIECLI